MGEADGIASTGSQWLLARGPSEECIRRRAARPTPEPLERSSCPRRSREGGSLEIALSEGLPVPREPAYAAKRSHDGEAPAASE
jgi:hypothetical protein